MRSLWVVETMRANGMMLSDHGHFYVGDAIDEAYEIFDAGDTCCDKNEPDFQGPCPGGCETRTPRVVEYRAERVEK